MARETGNPGREAEVLLNLSNLNSARGDRQLALDYLRFRIELAGEAVWRPNNAIRALDHMHLRFIAK